MKRHRHAPPRYLLTWSKAGNALPADRKGRERLYARQPIHLGDWGSRQPIRFEDLLHANVIFSSFDLRQDAHFATHQWPVREKALAALKKYYAPKPKPLDGGASVRASRRAKRLAVLLAKQKNWQRKARLAQTKLRKLKQQVRRAECQASGKRSDLTPRT